VVVGGARGEEALSCTFEEESRSEGVFEPCWLEVVELAILAKEVSLMKEKGGCTMPARWCEHVWKMLVVYERQRLWCGMVQGV
jgi:hypothetical protein